jgi:hypothetical protein
MIRVLLAVLLLVVALIPGGAAAAARPVVAVGSLTFDEMIWRRGSLPTLTFTVTSGRGPLEKSLLFLYVSELPQAFTTTTFPPQFVGAVLGSGSLQTVVQIPPLRLPITAHTPERFVQGAVFDARTGQLASVTNEDYLDIDYEAEPETFAIDFETEDDFATALVNGQDLSTPPEFGNLFSLSTVPAPPGGQVHYGAAIFDSDSAGPNAASSDQDLLVDQGNVVILQENPGQVVPGIFALPDDSAGGGKFVFEFTGFEFIEKVEPLAIDLVDIDGGVPRPTRVVLTDVLGHTRSYLVPAGWTRDIANEGPPGVGTLDLTTLAPQPGFAATATSSETLGYIPGEVVRLEVELGGSGALDNLVFRREADPSATSGATPAGPGRVRVR